MSPAQRDTNAALCRCVINWPYIHQDIPTGPLNSLTAPTIRPTPTSGSSMAFADDIHSRIRRVCDKITVIAVENFTRTSFHVDGACPPHIHSHIHTLARINPHTFVRECTSRLPHDGTEDIDRAKSKNGEKRKDDDKDDRMSTWMNKGNALEANKVIINTVCVASH